MGFGEVMKGARQSISKTMAGAATATKNVATSGKLKADIYFLENSIKGLQKEFGVEIYAPLAANDDAEVKRVFESFEAQIGPIEEMVDTKRGQLEELDADPDAKGDQPPPNLNPYLGVPLAEADGAPFVDELFAALDGHTAVEGIFRISPDHAQLRTVKTTLHADQPVDWAAQSPHVLGSTLKWYLAQLPDPLLTFELYDEFLSAASQGALQDRLPELLTRLPIANKLLLRKLLALLVKVANDERNKMTAENLGIVFGPSILRTETESPEQMMASMKHVKIVATALVDARILDSPSLNS